MKGLEIHGEGRLKCFCYATFAITINDKARDSSRQHGLRQGDTLSPFSFTIVVDVLSCMLPKWLERGIIEGLKVGQDKVEVSHFQFANDTICSFFMTL